MLTQPEQFKEIKFQLTLSKEMIPDLNILLEAKEILVNELITE